MHWQCSRDTVVPPQCVVPRGGATCCIIHYIMAGGVRRLCATLTCYLAPLLDRLHSPGADITLVARLLLHSQTHTLSTYTHHTHSTPATLFAALPSTHATHARWPVTHPLITSLLAAAGPVIE